MRLNVCSRDGVLRKVRAERIEGVVQDSFEPRSCLHQNSLSGLQVTTVDGPVDLRIPAGTQPGTTLVMAKRGVPRLGQDNLRGDHQVYVRVTIPQRLGKEETKLVEELRQLQDSKSNKRSGIFSF